MLEVYIKDGCPYCQKQLDDFKSEGLEYKTYNVGNPDNLKKARQDFGADKVPVVVKDGIVVSIGYNGLG